MLTTCPQCSLDTPLREIRENEGYCRTCCESNQAALDEHNFMFDRWEGLSDKERQDEIRRAMG